MKLARTSVRKSGGFTLVEVTVAVALIGVILANVYLVLDDTRSSLASQSVSKDVDTEARRALERIKLAVMGAVRDAVHTTVTAPMSSDWIDFESIVGFENGQPVRSDMQRIALTQEPSHSVSWFQNPGDADETRVVWARNLGVGEVPNGLDDNGNGLIDEKGLAFEVQDQMVKITLTIERPGPDGKPVTKTMETKVTCRN